MPIVNLPTTCHCDHHLPVHSMGQPAFCRYYGVGVHVCVVDPTTQERHVLHNIQNITGNGSSSAVTGCAGRVDQPVVGMRSERLIYELAMPTCLLCIEDLRRIGSLNASPYPGVYTPHTSLWGTQNGIHHFSGSPFGRFPICQSEGDPPSMQDGVCQYCMVTGVDRASNRATLERRRVFVNGDGLVHLLLSNRASPCGVMAVNSGEEVVQSVSCPECLSWRARVQDLERSGPSEVEPLKQPMVYRNQVWHRVDDTTGRPLCGIFIERRPHLQHRYILEAGSCPECVQALRNRGATSSLAQSIQEVEDAQILSVLLSAEPSLVTMESSLCGQEIQILRELEHSSQWDALDALASQILLTRGWEKVTLPSSRPLGSPRWSKSGVQRTQEAALALEREASQEESQVPNPSRFARDSFD